MRRTLAVALAALVTGVDQWVKGLMLGRLQLPEVGSIEILPFFNLTWTQNYGVSLGMFTAQSAEMRYMLVALTSAIALVVFGWMMREKARLELFALALVLGGALGNIR